MNDIPRQPFIFEGVDSEANLYPRAKSAATTAYETLSNAGNRIAETFENAKKPGMPLSVLSNVAREAPLASLLAAFLIGVAIARRR